MDEAFSLGQAIVVRDGYILATRQTSLAADTRRPHY
jgi:hypothetical protein